MGTHLLEPQDEQSVKICTGETSRIQDFSFQAGANVQNNMCDALNVANEVVNRTLDYCSNHDACYEGFFKQVTSCYKYSIMFLCCSILMCFYVVAS
jgi:hypothetical protein